VLVSASAYESFSIVLLEGWSVGTPAFVNGWCEVTREHALRSSAGLAFRSYPEFEVGLERLLASETTRATMGAAGRAYPQYCRAGAERGILRRADELGPGKVPHRARFGGRQRR